LAIISNALHDLGDSLSLGLAWYFQNVSTRTRDNTFSYGYGRFSLLGAIINSIVLTVGSFFILREAIPRIFNPEVSDAKGMLVFAVLGIIVNTVAMLRLRKGSTMNERVVSLHFLEDILGWVAVLIGSIVMHFTQILWIDPLLSILVSCLILFNVFRNMRTSLRILLQAIPDDLEIGAIEKRIQTLPNVCSIHDLHIWTLDGQYNILSLHVVVTNDTTMQQAEQLKIQIKGLLKDQAIQHVTLEIETEDEVCELEHH
jgi:cobalt-zinc-cadmium efflux system protein